MTREQMYAINDLLKKYKRGEITEESFVHKYPDWFYPKIICANVNCKYNGFRNMCTCKQVKFGFRHLHTTNEGLVDVFECKSFEEQEKSEEITKLENLMEFINKNSVYGLTCEEEEE